MEYLESLVGMIMIKCAFIITVYRNDELNFFREAIFSIKRQSYGFDKINIYLGIDGVLNSGVQNFINNNPDLFYKVIINPNNRGLAFTLNRLIDELEEEEYIFRMDSDDVSKIDRVELQIDYMEKNPVVEIIGGAIEEITSDGKVINTKHYPRSTAVAKKQISKASIFAHPAVCFRKSFFEKGFRYNDKFRFSQDLQLWFQALNNDIVIGNIDDLVLCLRVSNDFYKRRSYRKAFGEFKIYWNGIIKLHGFSLFLVFPVLRLLTRLLPRNVVKLIYRSKLRNLLNK